MSHSKMTGVQRAKRVEASKVMGSRAGKENTLLLSPKSNNQIRAETTILHSEPILRIDTKAWQMRIVRIRATMDTSDDGSEQEVEDGLSTDSLSDDGEMTGIPFLWNTLPIQMARLQRDELLLIPMGTKLRELSPKITCQNRKKGT